jgi:uncharacterized protein YihD (DUF1040 family)
MATRNRRIGKAKGRDPGRIGPLLAALRAYWKSHPDLRLGQILYNVACETGVDPFYLEDDVVLRRLGASGKKRSNRSNFS